MATSSQTQSEDSNKVFRCPYESQFDCHKRFETERQASTHGIINHQETPRLHRTQDGQYLCPFSDSHNCKAAEAVPEAMPQHLAAAHRGEKLPCAVAAEFGCTILSPNMYERGRHSRIHEPDRKRLPCPAAEEYSCSKTFATASSANSHLIGDHGSQRFPCPLAIEADCAKTFARPEYAAQHAKRHNTVRQVFPCPAAEQYGCSKTFVSFANANLHLSTVHSDERTFPCPWAEVASCTIKFKTASKAQTHAKVHDTNRERFPCPLAEEYHCTKTFVTVQTARIHADGVHLKTRIPCPLADEANCTMTFAFPNNVWSHVLSAHGGGQFPCPFAEELGCTEKFATARYAKKHSNIHSRSRDPFRCLRQGCDQRFPTLEEAIIHSKHPDHTSVTVYRCPLATCASAVAGRTYLRPIALEHMGFHKKGQAASDIDLVPQPVESVPVYSEIPLWTRIHLENCRKQGGETSSTGKSHLHDNDDDGQETADPTMMDDDVPDLDAEDDSEEHIMDTLAGEDFGLVGGEVLSQEHRARVVERNATKWERHSRMFVSFGSLGRTCIGPNSNGEGLVAERCPRESIIDLDSACLKRKRDVLVLGVRCVACEFHRTTTRIFEKAGIDFREENINCSVPGCGQASFHKSGRCRQHLQGLLWGSPVHSKPPSNLNKCQAIFASSSRKQWILPPSYNTILRRKEEIQRGKRPGSDLVVLDDEFSSASGQLWEFAIIEQISGNTIINTVIKHENDLDHGSASGSNPFRQFCSRSKARKVYAPSRGASIDRMNATEIADVLRKKGISRDTIFLVYGKNKSDLSILRHFLESNGLAGIVPSDENCYPITNIIRANLLDGVPKEEQFELRLDVVFPIIFPRHNMIGLNHQALVDYQQTRLVCKAMEELSKPFGEREARWCPATVTNISQRSILDWVKPEHGSEIGKDEDSPKRKHASGDIEIPTAKRVAKPRIE